MRIPELFLVGALLACTPQAASARSVPSTPTVLTGDCAVLTFDDGPHPLYTRLVLKALQRWGITVTFYLIGKNVLEHPDVVLEIIAAGHEIGNHSMTHPRHFGSLSNATIRLEMKKGDAAIESVAGYIPKTIRTPGGEAEERTRAIMGRPVIHWGEKEDTNDWKYRNTVHIRKVAVAARSRQPVLMHDIYATTAAAVPGIIEGLKARGFRFVTVSQWLAGACESKEPLQVTIN